MYHNRKCQGQKTMCSNHLQFKRCRNCKTNHGRTERASYFACLLEGINTLKIKNMHILKPSEYNFNVK